MDKWGCNEGLGARLGRRERQAKPEVHSLLGEVVFRVQEGRCAAGSDKRGSEANTSGRYRFTVVLPNDYMLTGVYIPLAHPGK